MPSSTQGMQPPPSIIGSPAVVASRISRTLVLYHFTTLKRYYFTTLKRFPKPRFVQLAQTNN